MNKTPSHTGSTLRLKILAIYIIFGFLAIFTTSILVSGYALDKLTDYTASRLYKSANVTASQYLPKYFNETISLSEVRTQLSGIESYTDAAVWLVDSEGNLIANLRMTTRMRQPSFLTLTQRKMSEASGKRVIITVVLPKMLLQLLLLSLRILQPKAIF